MRFRVAIIYLLVISILFPCYIVMADPSPNARNEDLYPLKDKYSDYFLLGNAASPDELDPSSPSFDILTRHFNAISTKEVLMPGALEGTNGVFNFDGADYVVKTAKENGLKVIGHALVWYNHTPDWFNANMTREEAIENLRTYIKTVVSHFGDDVYAWDVVNEAFYDQIIDPENWRGSLRQSPWYTVIGDDYIEIAFKAAREANPNVLLYYNDYNLDNPAKREAVYNMVKEFREKGIPIDGIGMQGIYASTVGLRNVEDSILRFSELGIVLSISELGLSVSGSLTAEKELKQAYRYAQLFQLFMEYSNVIERVTIWGINDESSNGSRNFSTLFTEDYKPKLAYEALCDPALFIENNPGVGDVKAYKQFSKAEFGMPTLSRILSPVWESAAPIDIGNYLTDWHGANATVRALWGEQYLYLLIEVKDRSLDFSSPDPYKQDSVMVYINEGFENPSADSGALYMVNCDNVPTFGLSASGENNFTSIAYKIDEGYAVQMQIPHKSIKPVHNTVIGFDVQVNDAEFGEIISIARWNDLSGMPYNAERLGKLILQKSTGRFVPQTAPGQVRNNLPHRLFRTKVFLIFFIILMMTCLCVIIYFTKKVKKS